MMPSQLMYHFPCANIIIFVELGGGVDDVPGWRRVGDMSNLASGDVDDWLM